MAEQNTADAENATEADATSSDAPSIIPEQIEEEELSLDALIDSITNLSELPQDAERIFHGRGDSFGPASKYLTLDLYPPVWLLTSFCKELEVDQLSRIESEISEFMIRSGGGEPTNIVYQYRSGSPTIKSYTNLIKGDVPDPHVVEERGMKFYVQLLSGQNHGLFLDMAAGRAWVRDFVQPGHKVLNMFAYTCPFSIAALCGGASQVINIDMARGPLKTGQRNHDLNGFGGTGVVRFFSHDILKSWGKLRKNSPYDLVLVDPPSFQKGSFVAKKDYKKVVKRLPELLSTGGTALLCLNAPELSTQFLKSLVSEAAPELRYLERIPNLATFPAADPERALKLLVFRMGEDNCEGLEN